MPHEIKAKIDEIMAKTERDPDGKTRKRILEQLQQIRELLRPTRYRRDSNGNLRGVGQAAGGGGLSGNTRNVSTPVVEAAVTAGGAQSGGCLADLGQLGWRTGQRRSGFDQGAVSKMDFARAEKTREEGELDDLAAEIVGDTLTGDLVKANRNFRGYRDLVGFFAKEFNPGGDVAIERKIVEYVEEWLESQLAQGHRDDARRI